MESSPVSDASPKTYVVLGCRRAGTSFVAEALGRLGIHFDVCGNGHNEDVDFCVRLGLAGWKILCDCSVGIAHIGNVTTRSLKDHPYARVAVRHGMQFREKWADVLPKIATIAEDDIYWGPIPRVED